MKQPLPKKGVQRVGRNAAVIALAGLAVRALGLVREATLAYFFGAGPARDALAIALRLPAVLRDLFAEGSMAAAFVPRFTEYREQKGDAAAHELANVMLGFLMVVVGLVVASFIFLGKWWVLLFAGGFKDKPETLELAVQLTALAGPFVLMVSMATVFMGMLNVRGKFFLPALAPCLLNLATIVGCLVGLPLQQWTGLQPITAVAAAYTVGGLLQMLGMYPALRRMGYRFRPRINFRHPGLVRIIFLMAPGLLGLAAVQLTSIIDMQIASRYADGVVSYVEYSFRLLQLPIGMVGMALATATLAKASLDMASKDNEALRATVSNSITMLFLVAMPVAGMLVAVADPITQAFYAQGEFTFEDAHKTARLVQLYALGTMGTALPRVLIPIFFTLGDSIRPMLLTLATIGLKLVLVVLLIPVMSYEGLVAATSIAVTAEAVALWWMLRRRIGKFIPGTASGLLRISVASVLATAAAWGALSLLGDSWYEPGKVRQLIKVCLGVGTGGVVYLIACAVLRVEELWVFLAKVRSKLKPPGPPPGAPPGAPPGPPPRG